MAKAEGFVTKAELEKALKEQQKKFEKTLREFCRVYGIKKEKYD